MTGFIDTPLKAILFVLLGYALIAFLGAVLNPRKPPTNPPL